MTINGQPDILHLGCGEDYREGELNVDAVPSVDPDQVVNLNHYPWPWDGESFAHIRANHVFEHLDSVEAALRECARVLKPGGTLRTAWPVGLDAIADPDHKQVWEWRTPEFYCGKRHWDTDVGLRVVDREVDLWPASGDNVFSAWDKLTWAVRHRLEGPGPWCFNQSGASGEFRVVFEKCGGRTPWNQ